MQLVEVGTQPDSYTHWPSYQYADQEADGNADQKADANANQKADGNTDKEADGDTN